VTGSTGATGAEGNPGAVGGSVLCPGGGEIVCEETLVNKPSLTNPGLGQLVGTALAGCKAGHLLLGGGANAENSNLKGAFGIIDSHRSSAGSGGRWEAAAQVFMAPHNAETKMTLTAYAICST
jgi:hypothetical protein